MMDVEMAEGIGRLSPGAAELCLIEQGGGFAPMAPGPARRGSAGPAPPPCPDERRPFEQLDYLYTSCVDVVADTAHFADVLAAG